MILSAPTSFSGLREDDVSRRTRLSPRMTDTLDTLSRPVTVGEALRVLWPASRDHSFFPWPLTLARQ